MKLSIEINGECLLGLLLALLRFAFGASESALAASRRRNYGCRNANAISFVLVAGRAHLREAVLRHEESQRLHRMCRELRGKNALLCELRRVHRRANEAYKVLEEEDDFRDLLDPLLIVGQYYIL